MNIILFIFIVFAISNIITREVVFKWLRKILNFKPFTCGVCMSVWVGIGLSFFFPIFNPLFNWFFMSMIGYTGFKVLDKIIDDFYLGDK